MKKILFFNLITYLFFSYDSYACTTVQTEKQPNIDELLQVEQPVIDYCDYFFDQDNPIISFDTENVIKELAEYINNKNTDHNVYPIDSDLLIAIVRILQDSKQKLKIAHDIDEICEFLKSKKQEFEQALEKAIIKKYNFYCKKRNKEGKATTSLASSSSFANQKSRTSSVSLYESFQIYQEVLDKISLPTASMEDTIERINRLIAKIEGMITSDLERYMGLVKSPHQIIRLISIVKQEKFTEEEKEEIEKAFFTIADSNVGKLLLKRIQIEIENLREKGHSPKLTIHKSNFHTSYNIANKHFYALDILPELVGKLNFTLFNAGKASQPHLMYKEGEPQLDVAIFHELVHWFHFLNDGKRAKEYKGGREGLITKVDNHPLYSFYYEGKDVKLPETKASLFIWSSLTSDVVPTYRVNFEEMLTICGLPSNKHGYKVGDELSENLYRAEKGLPLRFGHKLMTFVESRSIKLKVYECIDYYRIHFPMLQLKPPVYGEFSCKDYDDNSRNMAKIKGLDGMYFYTILTEYVKLYKNYLSEKMYIKENGRNPYYYYLLNSSCQSVLQGLKLD